jgi:putative FmdB family regulatory protein
MPVYLFMCSNCEIETVVTADINDATPKPECKSCQIPLDRKFGLQTIRFMGSGWGKDKN